MSIWVVMVKYYRTKEVNVSQEAYKTYNEAVTEIRKKIDPDFMQQHDYYNFHDFDNNISYELKSIYIK